MPISKEIHCSLLFDPSCEIISWNKDTTGRNYIEYVINDGSLLYAEFDNDAFESVDQRLPEVIEILLDGKTQCYETGKLLQLSLSIADCVEHRIDPHVVSEDTDSVGISRWYLHKIAKATRTEDPTKVYVELNIYNTRETASGARYAFTSMKTNLLRGMDWLELHFQGGPQLLSFAESIGASREETAGYLQSMYKPHQRHTRVAPESSLGSDLA